MSRLRYVIACLILAGMAASYFLWVAPGGSKSSQTIVVEEGANLSRLCPGLEKKGLIPGNCTTFRAMARIFGSRDPIQAGEFEIPKGMGGAAVLDLLQHGRPVQRLITVTEGMPSIIVEEKLAANPYLVGQAPTIAEGSVLPDSYGYQRGEARAALVVRMQKAMA